MLMAAEEKHERRTMADIQQMRRDWRTADELTEYVARLRDEAAKLEGFVRALTDLKGQEVYVDGVTKFARGMTLIAEFNENVQVAIIKKNIREKQPDTKKRIKRSG